jgi:hypothetical protein
MMSMSLKPSYWLLGLHGDAPLGRLYGYCVKGLESRKRSRFHNPTLGSTRPKAIVAECDGLSLI